MKPPDLSKLPRGQFRLVSVEKLMRMLTACDQDVEITVKPHPQAWRGWPDYRYSGSVGEDNEGATHELQIDRGSVRD